MCCTELLLRLFLIPDSRRVELRVLSLWACRRNVPAVSGSLSCGGRTQAGEDVGSRTGRGAAARPFKRTNTAFELRFSCDYVGFIHLLQN